MKREQVELAGPSLGDGVDQQIILLRLGELAAERIDRRALRDVVGKARQRVRIGTRIIGAVILIVEPRIIAERAARVDLRGADDLARRPDRGPRSLASRKRWMSMLPVILVGSLSWP